MKLNRKCVAIAAVAIVFFVAVGSSQASTEVKKQATIRFVNHGSIQDWQADGNQAIIIESIHNKWYRAELTFPCFDLPYAQSIGFEASPNGQLSRLSTIVIRGHRYHIRNLVEIPKPS